jgi:hypothetical protein
LREIKFEGKKRGSYRTKKERIKGFHGYENNVLNRRTRRQVETTEGQRLGC